MGFQAHWVQLIMQCVTTVKYSFLINGKPCGSLTPSRGLRQGDPLSSYLFLLCGEAFSALLDSRAAQNQLQGITVCEGAPVIHHLLFFDDSMLFGKASVEECVSIQSVLIDYEKASGQKVNYAKSNIVFSKGVPESVCSQLASILGVSIVE